MIQQSMEKKGFIMRNQKEILKSIKLISTRSAKLQRDIHAVAVECLQHAEAYGDATLMQSLYLALPTGQRREALLVWCNTYSPLRVTQQGQNCGLLKKDSPKYVPFDIESAIANPYYALSERSIGFKASPLDMEKVLRKAWAKAIEVEILTERGIDYDTGDDGYSPAAEIARVQTTASLLSLVIESPDRDKIAAAIDKKLGKAA